MTNRKAKLLVIYASIFFLLSGASLYYIFMKLGYSEDKNPVFISYDINDYIEVSPVIRNDYNDVYESINVSRIDIKNIDNSGVDTFLNEQNKIISYIDAYYKESKNKDIEELNSVKSVIKTQINGTILSIFYELDFILDENIFEDNYKSYVTTINYDLGSKAIITNENLLKKYNYSKEYIASKLFDENVLIDNGKVVIDKETHISLFKSDILSKREEYIKKIVFNFDNIIDMYIENNSLVLVYNSKDIKELFFDNKFSNELKIRYLK